MSSDSRNSKQDFHRNVVPIRSGEDGTETERKLAAARRLFSLHEYNLCEQVVQEVLAVDPLSSKAKALLELVSIKLSKRKLYKKMVDPKQPSRSLEAPPQKEPLNFETDINPPSRGGETANRDADLHRPTQASTHEEKHPPLVRSNRRPLRVRPEAAGEKALGFPRSSMRDQTIAAMVELLRDRNKGPGDWKTSQFGLATQEHTGDEAEASAPDPGNATISISTLHEPKRESPPRAGIVSETEDETQVLKEKVPQGRSEEESTLRADFLPGSLVELFETTGRLQDGQLQEHITNIQNGGMPPIAVPPSPAESPAAHDGEAILLSPSVAHPAVPKDENEIRLRTDQRPAPPVPPHPQERIQRVVRLPDVNVFDQVAPTRESPPLEFIDRKLEQRSEEIRNSEIKAVSIAQIKKYLYQEQYDLCAQELERIRGLFPQNAEIQAFAENTSRRLVDLKSMKNFEGTAKELMRSAVSFYQEGKFAKALDAAQQVLQVNPNHIQAREFVEFVQRRINPEKKKEFEAILEKYCKNCGTSIDSSSQFCHHCGKRLS
jgi:hypothetical protein